MQRSNSLQTRSIETDQGGLWDKPRLAKFLKVSKPTVDQWVSKGRGGPRHLKIGALVRFRPEDVFDYLESCARGGVVAERSN